MLLGIILLAGWGWTLLHSIKAFRIGPKTRHTVATRLEQYGDSARSRLQDHFKDAGLPYPPAKLIFACFKQERLLEIYACDEMGEYRWVHAYPIQGLSGGDGPKLRKGDCQVPEGFYRIESLNPNSRFHLSLRLDYPNALDRRQAALEGRTQMGGDIMIHGGSSSIGCLAMGDPAIEELFVLAADSGRENIEAILCPLDFRACGLSLESDPERPWVNTLYYSIAERLAQLPPSKSKELHEPL